MRHVIDSEFFRLVRRPANWIMPVILILFIGLIYGVQWAVYTFDEATGASAEESLQFQHIGANGLTFGGSVGAVLIAVMAAQTMGSEYSWGTIRALVPRSRRRSEIIGSKLVAVLTYAVTLTGVAVIASVLITLAIDLFSDVESTVNADVIGNIVASAGRTWLGIAVYGVMALMITVLTRSTAAGIAISLAMQFLEDTLFGLIGLASDFVSDLRRFFIADNVNALILANDVDAGNAGGFVGGNNDPWVAAAFLVGWSVVFAIVSFYVFQRRDITSG